MQFFNIGPWEVTVILMIAILLLGPRRMAEVARTVGLVSAQLRKISQEFTAGIQAELVELERETRRVAQSPPVEPPGPTVIDGESHSLPAEVSGDGRK